jgi:hypothetical protein
MKTPDGFTAKMMPQATPEDEAAARELGVTADEYRVMKPEIQAEEMRRAAGGSGTPPDIAAEENTAWRLRREPGLIKLRNETPNLLVQAAKTPGEVAQMILFVICYILELAGIVVMGGERLQKIPGLFQYVLLGILIFPTMWITSRIWAAIGERARDVFRIMVRFWPLTLIGLFFVLVLLKAIKQQLVH